MDPGSLIALGGLIVPPLFDLLKKKLLKKNIDSPEGTISTLATTKPEVLGEYVTSLSQLLDAKVKWFNRDVSGPLPLWVSAWRASIRPLVVTFALLHIGLSWFLKIDIDPNVRNFYIVIISEWVGERLTLER